MQTTNVFKWMLVGLAGCLMATAAVAEPTITDVVVRQRWPWSRLVDIDYVLNCETTQRVDVAVAAFNSATALSCPADSFSGDLSDVGQGARRIVWDPAKTAYTNEVMTQFRVSLSPTLVPAYMIVDLTKNLGEAGQITYRYDWSPWSDVTSNTEYMTSKLVLRRVPAGTFPMGSPGDEFGRQVNSEDLHTVKLTKGFYIGIFTITQAQWENIVDGSWPSYFNNATYAPTRPVETVSYDSIRGSSLGMGWPASEAVDGSSFLGLLRAKTGVIFDLPTDAQWEYAARAGTTTSLNNGTNVADSWYDANANLLARYRGNNGYIDGVTPPAQDCSDANGTARVGSYQANSWGVYDMHGNVWEWCLDWHTYSLGFDPVTDPPGYGAATGSRVCRGSCWNEGCGNIRSAMRIPVPPSGAYFNLGFRVRVNLP